MKRTEITSRLEARRKEAKETDGDAHNLAMNQITVFQLMLDRFDNDWYDADSDFNREYENTVQDLIEADEIEGREQ